MPRQSTNLTFSAGYDAAVFNAVQANKLWLAWFNFDTKDPVRRFGSVRWNLTENSNRMPICLV